MKNEWVTHGDAWEMHEECMGDAWGCMGMHEECMGDAWGRMGMHEECMGDAWDAWGELSVKNVTVKSLR